MKGKILNIIYLIYSVFYLLIILGVLTGKLSFGLGLGDLGILMALIIIVLIIGVLVGVKKRGQKIVIRWNFFVLAIMILTLIYFLLSLTLWRGAEIPWDGRIFIWISRKP